ncbi:hypothetical protein Pan44_49410 [Caulifigura coniformis]|uniref:SLA1 homology domain-containing protein n=1 Tax=Caulifigura coniformis TaxID=2527983 RepID=A0A517SL82_9PLAN|nr:hypothetical protein [Caulifigura coniformis]QDT56880.1 hypothetical protein Pan44_49410 [Caulifigura coniformis]
MFRLLACFLLASLTGCSFVVAEKDIAGEKGEFASFEPKLVGDWEQAVGKGEPPKVHVAPKVGEILRLERAGPDSKALVVKAIELHRADDGGEPTEVEVRNMVEDSFVIRVVKLGDVEVISATRRSVTGGGFLLKLEWVNDGFRVRLMAPKFFEKNPQLIPHRFQNKDVIITAEVETVHEFLKTHGKLAELWEEASPVCVRREKPAGAK